MAPAAFEDDDLISLADFAGALWSAELETRRFTLGQSDEDLQKFIAGKQSAIRMLRRNHPEGFPEPVGSEGRSALFRIGDLAAWWQASRSASAPTLEKGAIFDVQWSARRAVDAFAAQFGAEPTKAAVALILACLDSGIEPAKIRRAAATGSARIVSAVERLTNVPAQVKEALHVLASHCDTTDSHGLRLVEVCCAIVDTKFSRADLLDDVLARVATSPRRGRATSTSESFASVIAAVAGAVGGDLVVDLATGEGTLLLAVHSVADGAVRLAGREFDQFACALVNVRLFLHHIDVELSCGSSLDGPPPWRGDKVVLDPPLGSSRDHVRWMQRSIDCLVESGEAVVALPVSTADVTRPEWLEVGAAHASMIVYLPPLLRSDAGKSMVLWILSPNEITTDLIEVHGEGLGHQRKSSVSLDASEISSLAEAIRARKAFGRLDGALPLSVLQVPRGQGPSGSRAKGGSEGRSYGDEEWVFQDESPEIRNSVRAKELVHELIELLYRPLPFRVTAEQHRALARLYEKLKLHVPEGEPVVQTDATPRA